MTDSELKAQIRSIITAYATGGIGSEEALEEIEEAINE